MLIVEVVVTRSLPAGVKPLPTTFPARKAGTPFAMSEFLLKVSGAGAEGLSRL
ncbi:MAG: hypothetical protein ACLTGJ_02415 [Faecalibacterium prausnitzii]